MQDLEDMPVTGAAVITVKAGRQMLCLGLSVGREVSSTTGLAAAQGPTETPPTPPRVQIKCLLCQGPVPSFCRTRKVANNRNLK